jgi:hypothetical protein
MLSYLGDSSPAVCNFVPEVGANSDEGDISSGEVGIHARLILKPLDSGEKKPVMQRHLSNPMLHV